MIEKRSCDISHDILQKFVVTTAFVRKSTRPNPKNPHRNASFGFDSTYWPCRRLTLRRVVKNGFCDCFSVASC